MLEVGSVVAGRYQVEGELGRGGMGRVLVARHLVLGERVALKIVANAESGEAVPRARLLREARAAARLRSDYGVRVHDVFPLSPQDDRSGEEVGALCLVLEHVAGPTLAREIAERGPLPVEEAVGLALQIALGLAEAHAHAMVHRDLKPANVLLATLPSGRRRPRIIDFGIAKAPVFATSEATLTAEGALLGSPVYMAPEQITDPHGVDARADLWSLGVVLYELLTGGLPFEGLTTAGLLARIEHDPPRSPAELRADLPVELVSHVLRCLEKEPARRFADAGALGRALAPFGPAERAGAWAEEIVETLACRPTAPAEPELLTVDAPGSLTATEEPPRGERATPSAPVPPAAPSRSLLGPLLFTTIGLVAVAAFAFGRSSAPASAPGAAVATSPPAAASVASAAHAESVPASATATPRALPSAAPPESAAPPSASAAPPRKPVARTVKVAEESAPPDVFDRLGSRK